MAQTGRHIARVSRPTSRLNCSTKALEYASSGTRGILSPCLCTTTPVSMPRRDLAAQVGQPLVVRLEVDTAQLSEKVRVGAAVAWLPPDRRDRSRSVPCAFHYGPGVLPLALSGMGAIPFGAGLSCCAPSPGKPGSALPGFHPYRRWAKRPQTARRSLRAAALPRRPIPAANAPAHAPTPARRRPHRQLGRESTTTAARPPTAANQLDYVSLARLPPSAWRPAR